MWLHGMSVQGNHASLTRGKDIFVLVAKQRCSLILLTWYVDVNGSVDVWHVCVLKPIMKIKQEAKSSKVYMFVEK